MPNWCTNDVNITSTTEDKQELYKFLELVELDTPEKRAEATDNDTYKFFHHVIPTPAELLDSQALRNNDEQFANALLGNKGYEYDNWYDWRLAHWGTKWDVSLPFIDFTDDKLSLSYDTAWSPANEVLLKVSEMFPTLLVENNYLEEGMNFIGTTRFVSGEVVLDICLEITDAMYVAAGATLGADGKIDWEQNQLYNLFDLFEGPGLEAWVNK